MSNLHCGICGEWKCVCGNPVPAKNGYETILIVCSKMDKFLSIIATVDLSKVAYNNIEKLIEELRKNNHEIHEKHKTNIDKYYALRNSLENVLTKKYDYDIMNEIENKLLTFNRKLQEDLPYVYYSSRSYTDFSDDYGNLLMITDVSTVFDAIMNDNAIYEEKYKQTYRRFDVALSMLQGFKSADWAGELVVILWGH